MQDSEYEGDSMRYPLIYTSNFEIQDQGGEILARGVGKEFGRICVGGLNCSNGGVSMRCIVDGVERELKAGEILFTKQKVVQVKRKMTHEERSARMKEIWTKKRQEAEAGGR